MSNILYASTNEFKFTATTYKSLNYYERTAGECLNRTELSAGANERLQ